MRFRHASVIIANINEISNTIYVDMDAKKKAKIDKRVKALVFIVCVAIVVALILI